MKIIYLEQTLSYLASKGMDIQPIVDSGEVINISEDLRYLKINRF